MKRHNGTNSFLLEYQQDPQKNFELLKVSGTTIPRNLFDDRCVLTSSVRSQRIDSKLAITGAVFLPVSGTIIAPDGHLILSSSRSFVYISSSLIVRGDINIKRQNSTTQYMILSGDGTGNYITAVGPSTGKKRLIIESLYDIIAGTPSSNSEILFRVSSSLSPKNVMILTESGSVGIGTTVVNPWAVLDVVSISGAFIPPRMTTTQRDAMTPTNGMIVYNSTLNKFNFYQNGAWVTGTFGA